jgi:hypothetical protein
MGWSLHEERTYGFEHYIYAEAEFGRSMASLEPGHSETFGVPLPWIGQLDENFTQGHKTFLSVYGRKSIVFFELKKEMWRTLALGKMEEAANRRGLNGENF